MCLGVKSIRWKVKERVLERICHVIRMENNITTEAVVLVWYEGSECKEKNMRC